MLRESLNIMYQAMGDLIIIDDMANRQSQLGKDKKTCIADFKEKYKMQPGKFRELLEETLCQIQPGKNS